MRKLNERTEFLASLRAMVVTMSVDQITSMLAVIADAGREQDACVGLSRAVRDDDASFSAPMLVAMMDVAYDGNDHEMGAHNFL